MLCSCEKLYYNYYYIYWKILHLPNFSNNKVLYIVILLLPFAKCFFFSKWMPYYEGLRDSNTHIFYFQTFITSFKSKKTQKPIKNTHKKNCQTSLLHLKIVIELRKNLSSFFHHIKFIVFQTVWSKKNKEKNNLATVPRFFLLQIYTAW